MKTLAKTAFYSLLIVMFCGTFFACKKDVGPTLVLTVVNQSGQTVSGAAVHAYPDGATQGTWTSQADQTDTTDGSGQVKFSYANSVVMNVDVEDIAKHYDTTLSTFVYDTLSGSDVFQLDSKRQHSSKNDYAEKITVK